MSKSIATGVVRCKNDDGGGDKIGTVGSNASGRSPYECAGFIWFSKKRIYVTFANSSTKEVMLMAIGEGVVLAMGAPVGFNQ